MRVHLRGIILGVAVLLAVVIAISVFNALEEGEGGGRGGAPKRGSKKSLAQGPRGRASSLEDAGEGDPEGEEDDAPNKPSRTSARSSPRLTPQRGGAARAGPGGGGARAGGPGARAGGPGGRFAGGPAGPRGAAGRAAGAAAAAGGSRARGRPAMGGDDDDDDDDMIDIDETPEEEVMEATPKKRAGGRSRASSVENEKDEAKKNADDGEEEEKKKKEREIQKEREEKEEQEKKEREKKEQEKEEAEAKKSSKKEPPYPDWWKTSYPRSSVVSQSGQFVDDQALFPQCPFSGASPSDVKTKTFGFVEPPRYLKNSRNPCWFEWNGKKDIIKCLPYFYIAGAPKSGAADLYNRLQGHPYILQGGGPFYSWWDRLRYGASKSLKYTREARRTPDAVVQFKEYAKDIVGKHGKNLTKEVLYSGESLSIIGDASATYLTDNTQWDVYEGNEGCSEPRIITASFIRHIYPQARLVLMLRDPVDRLYSRFLANVPYVYEYENHTSALFHTFVVKAVQSYRECIARLSIRHCAYNTSLYTSSVVRLSEGMYSVFVEDWIRVFPKDQLMIIRFEDYAKDVQGYIHRVFQHLGVDPIDEVSELKLAELPVVRRGKKKEDAGYIKKETLDVLADFYRPFNLRLAELLDDDQWLFERDAAQDAAVDLTPAFPLSPFGPGVSVASEGSAVVAMEQQQVGESNPPAAAAGAGAEASQPQPQAEAESEAALNAGETEIAAADTAVNNGGEGEGGEGLGDGEGEKEEGETAEGGVTGDV